MNDKPETKIGYVSPLKRICMTIGELPTSYLETMSYYEMLIWFTKFLQEKVIPTIDNNAQAVEELQQLFIELQSYVNNYFDNLDVQDEINNKLDQMLEDGVLEQIIEQYLNSSAIWGFDTVSDMKEATNLINGSYAKTLGYTTINDGGTSTYKIREITNNDVVDNMFIIALQNEELIAELVINNQLLLSQIGANTSSSSLINTQILNKALQYINNHKNITLIIDNSYIFDNIDLTNINGISIKGTNETQEINVNNSIIIPTNRNNFENLCFELQTNATLLNVSGTYNTFTNCKFYGKNNHTGIGANISSYVNTFINCSFREFAKCIIASNNQINFINCIIIGNDNPSENEDTITINGGMNINFTNCDIEKGYHIITINNGLINFNGCYIEGATSRYHILLNDGITTIENNYLNNIRVGKYSNAKLTFINNFIEKTLAEDYTIFPLEENIGYIVITNNKFKDEKGYVINIENIRNYGITVPCPRYYNGTDWVIGVRNDYIYIIQERCYGYGIGEYTAEILPIFKPNSGSSYHRTFPAINTLIRGDTFYDTTLNKLLVKVDGGWVDYNGTAVN